MKLFGYSVFNRVNIFFILLWLYFILDLLTSDADTGMVDVGGNIINKILGGLLIVHSIFYSRQRTASIGVIKSAKLLLYYLLFQHFIFVLVDFKTALQSSTAILNIIYWLSGFIFCINNFKNHQKKSLDKLLLVTILLGFANIVYRLITQSALAIVLGQDGAVNNAGSTYMLVPVLLLCLKGRWKIVGYILALLVCALSLKRQAMLNFTVFSLFVFNDLFKLYMRKYAIICITILIGLLSFGRPYIEMIFEGIMLRQEMLEDKGDVDSGRADLREASLQRFNNASLINKVFGGGSAAANRYINKYLGYMSAPHCGFIEILCDYGIFGLLLFVYFIFQLVVFARRFAANSILRHILYGIIATWMILYCVSHAGNLWLLYYALAISYVYNIFYLNRKLDLSLDEL